MIERKFVTEKIKEQAIKEFLAKKLSKAGYSSTEIQRTPLGEKIIIYTTRPGLVVGVKGENTRKLTQTLKQKFKLENPQIEVGEVENPFLDPHSVADKIAYVLETYGSTRFKSTGYRTLQNIMDAGALGAEIVISGKVPSARAKTWKFAAGYLKKSGDISENKVLKAHTVAKLKPGIVGIKVRIMPANITLPDQLLSQIKPPQEEKEKQEEASKEEVKATKKVKKKPNKVASKKEKVPKKDAKKEKKSKIKQKKEIKSKEDGNNKKK